MASIKSAVSVGTVLGLLTCLVFPNSTSMWICIETDRVSTDSDEMTLSCRPYDPDQDGSDLSVSYSFYYDYKDDLSLEVEVTADSISFEEASLQVVLTCSDGRTPTETIRFYEVDKGTSDSGRVYGPLCDEGQSVTNISITPEWGRDWRCDGCGTYEVESE